MNKFSAELGGGALFASAPELVNGKFIGQIAGQACFGDAIIQRVEQWMRKTNKTYTRQLCFRRTLTMFLSINNNR